MTDPEFLVERKIRIFESADTFTQRCEQMTVKELMEELAIWLKMNDGKIFGKYTNRLLLISRMRMRAERRKRNYQDINWQKEGF